MSKKVTLQQAFAKTKKTDHDSKPANDNKKIVVGYYLHPEVKSQMRVLAAEKGVNASVLAAEAFNDLFKKYGKASIA